ncbi:MAG: bacterioferritin [Cardiobacteriaceae bacterium]|nr:bacterioferritin [Cardiobacteriaceae bacterium]
MKTQPEINARLNVLLRHELTVINQYFLHARMLKNWGYGELGEVFYKQSIRAMKNADKLIERIFFLEGLPNLQDLGKLFIGESVSEAIDCDRRAAGQQYQEQQEAIAFFESREDFVSRDLTERLLASNEEYIDWLDEQKGLLESLGTANYLQSAAGAGHH